MNDGEKHDDSLCSYPILTPEGFALPKCLDLVSADDVVNAVENYLKYDSYAWRAIYAANRQG